MHQARAHNSDRCHHRLVWYALVKVGLRHDEFVIERLDLTDEKDGSSEQETKVVRKPHRFSDNSGAEDRWIEDAPEYFLPRAVVDFLFTLDFLCNRLRPSEYEHTRKFLSINDNNNNNGYQ
jgi:hypothetical protein